ALGRLELLQQQPHERRLTGAGGADDEDELALVNAEADLPERDHVGVVDLRHGLEHDHRARTGRPAVLCYRWLGERCCAIGRDVVSIVHGSRARPLDRAPRAKSLEIVTDDGATGLYQPPWLAGRSG